MPIGPNLRRAALVGAGLAVLTVAAYGQVGGFAFLNYDDPEYVSRNPVVQQGLTPGGLVWAFTAQVANNWHPVTWLSHMLDCELFGLAPGAHHRVSVAIHTLAAVLLLLILARITGAWWRSAFVAALFALHPLHVESVAWISERKDVLSALFWILTIGAYAAYVERPGRARFLLVALGHALGLMAKPMAVTLPFVLLLLDYWPLRRPGRTVRGLIVEKLPLLALSLVSCVVTFQVQRGGGAMGSAERYSIPVRLANALVAYASYIGKLLVPRNLAVLYPYPRSLPLWQVAGSAAILVILSTVAVLASRRRPYVLVGWLWFLGTLVPVIGLVQVGAQSMADRYTYLPSIGFFLLVTWSVAELASGERWRKAALGAGAVAVVLCCAAATHAQARYWRDSVALFTHTLAVTDDNAIARYNLGQALSLLGRTDAALGEYTEAVRIEPDYPEARNNLGLALFMKGETAAAIDQYEAALRLDPKLGSVRFNLGIALSRQQEWTRAAEELTAASHADPNDPRIFDYLGRALRSLGELPEASARFREAVRLAPGYAEGQFYLGLTAAEQGNLEEAVAALSAAARLEPGSAEAHAQLGFALARRNELREAIAEMREALRLQPNHVEALDHLARMLATSPDAAFRDGPEAVRLAERACRLTGYRRPELIDTLAEALAQAGRFTEAARARRKAHDLAVPEGRASPGPRRAGSPAEAPWN